jgi:hypothetical protein
MKPQLLRQIFEKYSNVIFHENPSSSSRVVTYGRADVQTDRQTDMKKLLTAYRNFANAPKKGKDVPIYALKAYRKSRDTAALQRH